MPRSCILALLFLSVFFSAKPVRAQREVLYAQYLTNPLTINPAYTGQREAMTLTAHFRRKWFGVQGLPITQSLGIDGATAGNRFGLGLQALNDRMSPYSNTGLYGSLAYHLSVGSGKLSVGGSGGVNILPVFDPASGGGFNKALPSLGLGAHFESEAAWVGVSMPELVKRPLTLSSGVGGATLQYNRPLFIHVGAKLRSQDNLTILPSILLTRQASRPLGIDLNAKVWLYEKLALGASARLQSSGVFGARTYFHGLAEYQLSPGIRVGYTYSSQTVEAPFLLPNSVHELVFRYTPSPVGFSLR